MKKGYSISGELSAKYERQKLYVLVAYPLAFLDKFDMSRDGVKHRNIREFLLLPEWD